MRLLYSKLNIEYEFKENEVLSLVAESPKCFSEMVQSLWHQTNGLPGLFSMFEAEKEHSIEKELECIINPFAPDINDKKIIGALYKDLKQIADEELQEEFLQSNSQMVSTIDSLIAKTPYTLEMNPDLDIPALLKLYNVKLIASRDNFLETIEDYIRLKKELCGISYYAVVNLKYYLTEEEIQEFYKFLFYEKAFLVDIESRVNGCYAEERRIVIDKDLCVITED